MILSSINHKGGTGKSLVSQNLAVAYAAKGLKTCIIDADPSQNSMMWFTGREDPKYKVTVFSNTNHRSLRKTVSDCYENQNFEVVIIDSPPTLEKISKEIIAISHIVLIPLTPTGGHDIWSTEQLAEMIKDLEAEHEKKFPSYFLVNRLQHGFTAHEMFLSALEEHSSEYGIPSLKSRFHLRTAYGASNMNCKTAIEWDDSKAKSEVQNLANELETIFDNL